MDRPVPLRPAGAEQHTPEYRVVSVYWTVAEAELARGLLGAEGIPVALLDTVDASLLPGTAPVRLLVPARDLDRSRRLLDGSRPVLVEAASSPGCGRAARAFWSTLALALIGVAVIFAALIAL